MSEIISAPRIHISSSTFVHGADGQSGKPRQIGSAENQLALELLAMLQAEQAGEGVRGSAIQQLVRLRLADPAVEVPVDNLIQQFQQMIQASEGGAAERQIGEAMASSARSVVENLVGSGVRTAPSGAQGGEDFIGFEPDSKFALLMALMFVMLEVSKDQREQSSELTKIGRQATVDAGNFGEDAAQKRMGGAITAVGLTAAMSGAQLKQNFSSARLTKLDYKHNIGNRNQATQSIAATKQGGRAASSDVVKNTEQKSFIGVDGVSRQLPAQTAPTEAQKAVINNDVSSRTPGDFELNHGLASAELQKKTALAYATGQLTAPVSTLANSASDVAAAVDEKQRMLMQHNAETEGRIAEGQRDQAQENRTQAKAALEILQSLRQQANETANLITGNMAA